MSIRWNRHLIILYDKQRGSLICDALEQVIGSAFPGCDVVTVDDAGYLGAGNRFWRVKASRFYAGKAPFLIRWFSKLNEKKDANRIKTERDAILSETPEKLSFSDRHNAAIGRIVNIFKRFRPAVIVATNRYSLKLTLLARRITGMDVKVVAVISDFALSGGFVRSGVDLYLVENESLKDGLMRCGVDGDKIVISGMPFVEKQSATRPREEARKLLGLSGDLPLVVVNGGDYCTSTIKEHVERLLKEQGRYSLLVLTYGNASIRRHYKKIAEEYDIEVLFKQELDYPLVFAAADIIVSIPDTHFVFSAFVNSIPVVLLDGITVLEHDVYRYLVGNALVTPSKNAEETYAAVEELLVDAERRKEMIEREQRYYLKQKALAPTLTVREFLAINPPPPDGEE